MLGIASWIEGYSWWILVVTVLSGTAMTASRTSPGWCGAASISGGDFATGAGGVSRRDEDFART